MFRDPLERWEIGVYPLLSMALMAWLSWPPGFYWSQVLRWETLLWAGLGVVEIDRFRHQHPGLSRVILIALSLSLSFVLFNPGNPRLMFWIALGLLGYLWFLLSIPEVLRRAGRWLRVRKK
ncbi:MAG: hypothetical protein N2Z75_05835 [Meiothermus sp.]|nr:hypothetical protein [Meiothermus sp.]